MAEMTPAELEALGIEWPPTEDELPCDDGMPMETQRHALQMQLLIDPLRLFWADRTDAYVGGNMFIYFSLEQARHQDFRGPDFFAVLGVPKRERKSWVVWQEGKGPDVVIELLSESTAAQDKGEKKDVYQDRLRVPEYFWFDPFTAEWAGFTLRNGGYEPLTEDGQGRLTASVWSLLWSGGTASIKTSRPAGYAGRRWRGHCYQRRRRSLPKHNDRLLRPNSRLLRPNNRLLRLNDRLLRLNNRLLRPTVRLSRRTTRQWH